MRETALQLLGDGVDVAEAALQRMAFEDRGGAGGIVGEIDGFASAMNGVGRGHAQGDAMIDGEHAAGAEFLPDRSQLLHQEGAGRADRHFGLGKVGLHHGAVADRALCAARNLGARGLDEIVQRAPGDGYYTRILSKLIGPKGRLYAVVPMSDMALAAVKAAKFPRSVSSDESGKLSGDTLKHMIDLADAGKIDGICFAPLNKGAMNRGGWKYPDEHQMFAALTKHKGFFGEKNVIKEFSTFRVTSHIALKEAVNMITP